MPSKAISGTNPATLRLIKIGSFRSTKTAKDPIDVGQAELKSFTPPLHYVTNSTKEVGRLGLVDRALGSGDRVRGSNPSHD